MRWCVSVINESQRFKLSLLPGTCGLFSFKSNGTWQDGVTEQQQQRVEQQQCYLFYVLVLFIVCCYFLLLYEIWFDIGLLNG